MASLEKNHGTCAYCGKITARSAMGKHLASCVARKSVSEGKKGGKEAENLYHLVLQAEGLDQFWLHLEMRGAATLKDLDKYLRHIWLECCGHMSEFSEKGWRSPAIPVSRKADRVFSPGVKLTHIYDFGTESVTSIRVAGVRQAVPTTARPIALMARNIMPDCLCLDCGTVSKWLCMECLSEEDAWNTFCDEHIKQHPHDEEDGAVSLVNSPRLGCCGYTGPAEPPY